VAGPILRFSSVPDTAVKHIQGFLGNAIMVDNSKLPPDDTLVCIVQTDNCLAKMQADR
jgi:hypothetical protein